MSEDMLTSRRGALGLILRFVALAPPLGQQLFAQTERQPLIAQVQRLVETLAYLGEPLSETDRERLDAAASLAEPARAIDEIQRVLDPRCLLIVRINPESRVSTERGAATARLVEQGWRAYLVKVRNEAGVTAALSLESPQARPVYRPGTGLSMAPQSVRPADVSVGAVLNGDPATTTSASSLRERTVRSRRLPR